MTFVAIVAAFAAASGVAAFSSSARMGLSRGYITSSQGSVRHESVFFAARSRTIRSRHQIWDLRRQGTVTLWASSGEDEPDEEEWKALVAAFQMYKAAYGDLKVPSRFVVPAMPPWPKSAWNFKLGQRVAAIRSTGRFVQNNAERRKLLEDMGFVWRLRATSKDKVMDGVSFDQVYDALETYRETIQPDSGMLSIPPNFVVPDCDPWPESARGLPLGKLIPRVRTRAYLKNNPGAVEKLTKLGFEFNGKAAANDARFNKVYVALKCYKEIYGDLLVPQPFVVPDQSDDWPEDTWGLRLGARVNAIRSQGTFVNTNPARRKLLDDLGFAWSPPTADGAKRRGRRKREDPVLPLRPAPRDRLSSEDQTKPGESPGFDSTPTQASVAAVDSLLGPAFGYSQDPFLAGKDATKPAPTWGFESDREVEAVRKAEEAKKAAEDDYKPPALLSDTLKEAADKAVACGVIEFMTDDNRIKKGKRDKEIPWFNDDFGDGFVFEDVVEALTLYKSIYSNFSALVANDEYVIPSLSSIDDQPGVGLSSFDTEASARAAAAIAVFEEQGKTEESEDLITAEIKRLQGEVESPVSMETEVAVEDRLAIRQWPEHLAGMSLGNIVRRIRDGSLEVKHLPERKAQLDALDFDWGDPQRFLDVPFEKAMCSMFAYYLVRGDMFVYEDFVMPDEDPWPKALAGYELGKAVKRIRELQNFMEAFHPEKVGLLRSIDFMWFPNLALPIDPNEGEMTPEMLLVIAHGHPDYAKMVDIPMGLPEKIMADGPFFESDDPKQWWRKWHNWDYVKDYWYAQGRRDNGFVLRQSGYRVLADEHEAKYGPGMFQQLNETMAELEAGVEDKTDDELRALVKKLKYFREEMTECIDIPTKDKEQLLEDLDLALLSLIDGEDADEDEEDFFEEYEYEEELSDETASQVENISNVAVEEDVVDEELVEEDFVETEDEELDIEDELGLDG